MNETYYALSNGIDETSPKEVGQSYPSIDALKHALKKDAIISWDSWLKDPHAGPAGDGKDFCEEVVIVKVVGKFKPIIHVKTSVTIKKL